MTMYSASWVLERLGGTLCKVYDFLTTMLYTSSTQNNSECKL